MKFSVKGLAMASGILWGVAMLSMGLANLIWGSYGQQFLQVMASVYPGYRNPQHHGRHRCDALRNRGRIHRRCGFRLAVQPIC